MFNKLNNNKNILVIFIVICFVLFYKLGTYGVVESSEARYAEISRAMYLSGDYIHPNLMGIHHYHKPPITYQITALAYKIFGINPFAARFFLQIALLLQLIIVYKISYLLKKNKQIAIWASLIYFSFPIVIISIRNLTTDAYLNTFSLFSIYFWILYKTKSNIKYLYAFTLNLALGFLTKGPLIFITPVVFIVFYNKYVSKKLKFTYHHILAWLIFLIVGLSWYLYLDTENHHFLNYFIGYQTIDRFASNDFNRSEPFWYFIILAPILGLPWSIFLIKKLINKTKILNTKNLETILMLSIVIPIIFFSLSASKRVLYILPLYGLAAILVAIQLYKYKVTTSSKIIIYGFTILILSSLILGPYLKLSYIFPRQTSYFGIIGLLIIIYTIKIKKISFKNKFVLWPFISMCILLLSFPELYSKNEIKDNPTKTITDFIKTNHLENRTTFVYNRFKPSVAFNLNKSIISLNNGDRSLNYNRDTQFEKDTLWKKEFIDLRKSPELNYYKKLINKPNVLIILTKDAKIDSLNFLIKPYQKLKQFNKWRLYY